MVEHVGLVVSGRAAVRMDDGEERIMEPAISSTSRPGTTAGWSATSRTYRFTSWAARATRNDPRAHRVLADGHGRRARERAGRHPRRRRFLTRLRELGLPFLVLTNNSIYTPRDLAARLRRTGLDVPEESIWTSALATAPVPRRPASGRLGVRDRRVGTHHRAARPRLHDHRARPRLRRARRDAHVQLRAHHAGDPADGGRRALHRHEPGQRRPHARRAAPGHRLGRRSDQPRHRRGPLLRGQAEPAHDALRAQRDPGPLGDHGDDRRPHGHRRGRRARGRAWRRSS